MSDGQVRVVKLDIDIPYELWKKLFKDVFLRKLWFCQTLFNISKVFVNMRRSEKSGNVHVHIVLDKPIDPETYFKLKYCLGEDHKRLTWSWKRYEKTGKILDFFWNKPIELKKRNKCGEACAEE